MLTEVLDGEDAIASTRDTCAPQNYHANSMEVVLGEFLRLRTDFDSLMAAALVWGAVLVEE